MGLLVGRPVEAVMLALGALSAVLTDGALTYRLRMVSILPPQMIGVAGTFAMLWSQGTWAGPWMLPAIGVVAGVLARLGPEGSLCAMIMLMDAGLAMDLPVPGPVWRGPTLLLVGGLLVVALAVLGAVEDWDHVVEVRSFNHMIDPRRCRPAA
ncbi:hypothetical protein ACIQ9P_38205 [Kitasatospora sp. NPDC094019]|uniref:hypothetical protein n=1 Tax=Kitasatospora sp. NPDC094019 TaxID=3364091 RepID=UPI0037FEB4B8